MGLVLKFDKTEDGLVIDGNPVTIFLGNESCLVETSSFSLTYKLPPHALPEGSKHEISYTFKADDTGVVTSVECGRFEVMDHPITGKRYVSDSFPEMDYVYLLDDAVVLEFFKVTVDGTVMSVKDYLSIRPGNPLENSLDHIGW